MIFSKNKITSKCAVLTIDRCCRLTGERKLRGKTMVVRRYGTLERSRTDILRRSDMPESMWCRDRFWAPELFFFDGWFYLTFNCRNESEEYRHSHSVGLARSKNVTGPYEVLTKEHGLTEGVPGDNDASLYAENGIFYLLCNEKHGIHMYKLDPETVTLSAGRKL